jgi:chaperone required for assembly of F1-ATPase
MRRFYKSVSVAPDLGITLDKRPLRTPLKAPLVLPTQALAEAIAAEWERQGEKVDPFSMPLTRLANTGIDRVAAERDKIVGEIVAFAGSDLVSYRADEPLALVERQAESWDPILDWARRELDAPFMATSGVMHLRQPEAALNAFAGHLSRRSDLAVAALHNLTTLTGSALMAAMIEAGQLSAEDAWRAAHVDEDWQVEHWGEDAEAAAKRARRQIEFESSCRFLSLLTDAA